MNNLIVVVKGDSQAEGSPLPADSLFIARTERPGGGRIMVNRFRGILGLAAALVLVAFVTGCTTTQSPGTQIDDGAISTAVKAKLTGERFSNLFNVEVNVTNGIVTLAGEVANAQVKADAEKEARSVDGVKGVNNNLQVKSPPTP